MSRVTQISKRYLSKGVLGGIIRVTEAAVYMIASEKEQKKENKNLFYAF